MKKNKMGLLTRLLLPLAIRIAAKVAKKVTPELRGELEEYVLLWAIKAAETPNKIDDIAVDMLKGILGMKRK